MYQVKNHNGTLLGEFHTKQCAEAEASVYRAETGNAAYVARISQKTLDIDTIAQNALDAACASIQDDLGVNTGDLAGMFFTGEAEENFMRVIKSYIRCEIDCKN
jgi:hypothetical protein